MRKQVILTVFIMLLVITTCGAASATSQFPIQKIIDVSGTWTGNPPFPGTSDYTYKLIQCGTHILGTLRCKVVYAQPTYYNYRVKGTIDTGGNIKLVANPTSGSGDPLIYNGQVSSDLRTITGTMNDDGLTFVLNGRAHYKYALILPDTWCIQTQLGAL